MDEEVINDLYSRAKSKGYQKNRDEFVKLLHSDSEVLNDMYSYVKGKGYKKDINSFNSLIGKNEAPTQKKKFASELSSVDGSSESPRSIKPLSDMPTLDQQGLEEAMAKRQSVPTDMSGTPIVDTKAQKAAKPIIEKISKNKPELIKPRVLKEQEEKESYLENLGTNVMASVNDVDKIIASIPETVYGFFSMPQNLVAYLTGLDISTSADKFKKNVGIANPVLDYYKEEGKKLEKEITDFNKERYKSSSIYDNIENGNYGDAFELLGSGIARSAPMSIAMMAGGATLSASELAAASTAAFYNQNLEEIQEENPNASEIENNIKALGMAAAEGVFSSIGEGQIGAVYKDIIKREGVEVGQQVFKDGLVQMYKGALEKYGVPVGLLGEGIEESATQITQNMISGKPAFDGAADAFILGGGSGVMFTAPISLKNAKDKIKNKMIEVDDKKKINTILEGSNETFSKAFDVPKDSEINEKQLSIASLSKSRDLLVKDLKSSVKKGDMTEDQAKQSLYVFDKTQQITGQLRGVDIDEKSKVKVANLLKERETLSDKITGKDPALSILEKQRIDEINKEIQDTILKSKEDAIQEQSTTEIPVQSETGVSEEVEGRTPEAEPEIVTEQITQEEVVEEPRIKDSQIPLKRETYEVLNDNGDIITVKVTINKDGSRNIRQEIDGDFAGEERVGKDVTLSNEEYVTKAYGDIQGEPKTQSMEEIMNPKMKEKLTPQQKSELGIESEVTAPQTIIEEKAPVETKQQSDLQKELQKMQAPQKLIDAIPTDTTLREGFLSDMKDLSSSLFGQAGVFKIPENSVNVGKFFSALSGGRDRILLHEAAHAATVITMNDILINPNDYTAEQVQANNDLWDIADKYNLNRTSNAAIFQPYGINNQYEFVAEFISNPKFREFVGKNNPDDKVRLRDLIWTKILQMLGMSKKEISTERIAQIEKAIDTTLGASIERNKRNKAKTQTQENETEQQPTVQPEPTGDRGRRTDSREIAPLEGTPTIQGATGPDPQLVAVAEQYAADNGIDLKRQSEYVEVDEERAQRIAQAYEEMAHDPQNPKVKEAYAELIKQTIAQYQALVDAGYKFWFMDLNIPSNVEYAESPYNAMRDLRQNKEMGVFPTTDGFGTSELDVNDNPLLAETGFEWPVGGLDGEMKPVLANDLFRAVHDAFGHGLEGSGFRARGEENAWQAHIRLFTGPAKGAITSETRGQNSWLNYGPEGENNRAAKVEDTIFADQKTGLMPEWTWTEGLAGDMEAEAQVAENLSQELSETDLPGYDRTMAEVEGIVQKSKQRKVSEPKMLDNVMSYVMGSKIYEDATDVQREALVRDVRKRFGLRERQAPSVNKLFGKIKDVKKITMTEKAALIKQIKDRIKGAKDVIKTQKEIASQIADEVNELRTKGKITVNQAANIVSKFSKLNLLNETAVSNFTDYISKVFADAEYDNKINIAKSKLAKAKQNIVTKLGIADGLVLPLQRLFSINPTLIPEQSLNRYLELLDMFSARQQVLNLEEKSVVTKDVQDILDEINNEQSLSDELADRFEASESKVFKDDVLDYAASVKNMLKNGEIDEKEAELMTKYKDRIVEKEERAKMTEEEIEAEKEILTKEIKKATVNSNGLPTRDEKELAKRFSRLIKGDAIKELTNAELKNILKIIDNINNNYLPHYTQLMVEKMNDINKSKILENAVDKSKPLTISKLYSEIKSLFTKKDAILEMIRRNPLFYIDQVLGDFKTKDIFNSVLEMAAEGESNFTADFKKVKEKLDKAQNDVAKSFTFKDKLNPNKVLESSFKMMTYAIQLEYDSNVGNKEVNPASEYLKATIKHINDGKSQFGERDAEVLQKILDEYSDSEGNIDNEKLYNSFNNAEKNAIKTVREVNESLTEKAEYTAAIIRGQKINPLTNYIHLNVLHEHKPSDLTSGASFIDSYNNSIRPSTKAKSLIERTGKVSPLNFDIFSSAERGAKFVLMDYNLTEPIRTARKTINRTIANLEKNGKMSKKNRKVINAINAAVEESIDNLLVNSYTSTSVVDDAINYISKQGYRSVLAGTGRFVSEFLSNVGFIIISDPNTFTEGIKNMDVIMSADAPQIMQNVNSKETNRIFPSDLLSGRMIDTSVLNEASGVKGGKTKNAVVNRLEQFWNRTGKKYKNGVELTADFLISTPDKAIMRPIWFGSFANQFEKITGKKVDFKKIAQNDEAYMEKNREAIEEAKNIADERSVITGASSNAFTGILKGTVKPDQSATVKAFNNFNNFMSKFLIYEYVTARTGIYAAMGNGSLTRRQGAALLGAVTTRMTVYSLLTKALGAGIIGLLFDDEEEEDKAIEKTTGQALASTFTSLLLGRDFGNAPKTLINYGVERMNEEYLQALREGDYDPYKDSFQYTALPVAQKGKQISIDDLITRMSGSFGPAANTTNLVLKKIYEPEKKEADAIERSEKEKNVRIPLEIAGNLGFVPLYKEIRKTVMKDMYEDLRNPMLKIERLKKTNPELYERFKKLQAKSLDKEFQAKLEERRKRMEERLKKKIEEREKKD
jgi:hypothetical protein